MENRIIIPTTKPPPKKNKKIAPKLEQDVANALSLVPKVGLVAYVGPKNEYMHENLELWQSNRKRQGSLLKALEVIQ